jgi:hypothetical protein
MKLFEKSDFQERPFTMELLGLSSIPVGRMLMMFKQARRISNPEKKV